MKLTWLGHASWLIETTQHRLLLDPFLTDNPAANRSPDSFEKIDHILVSHGHFDHVADVAGIAKQHSAQVIANFEVAQWLSSQQQVENTLGMNIGGSVDLPFGKLTMTFAIHSSSMPDGSYGGTAAGFLLHLEEKRVYFACDTALFTDMELIGEAGIDVAVLPIGDLFTMGPAASVEAVKLINPRIVLPTHYGTWPPIEQDAQQWANMVHEHTKAEAHVLAIDTPFEC